MASTQELLATIVADFGALRVAYEKAGLLGDGAQTEVAKKLLGDGEDRYRFKRDFLVADALVRNRVGRLIHDRSGPRHLAVFGGNNVAKSTAVNILVGEKVTGTSPEGGYTLHAAAVVSPNVVGGCGGLLGGNEFAFHRFSKVPAQDLHANRLDRYGETVRSSHELPEDVVVWDTPDCDAVNADTYMAAVVEVVTLADALVYVTSVGRFAVAHIVEWLFILHDAGVRFVQCFNMIKRADLPTVINNQKTRHFPVMAERLGLPAPDPPIIGLRYLVDGRAQLVGTPLPRGEGTPKDVIEGPGRRKPATSQPRRARFRQQARRTFVEPAARSYPRLEICRPKSTRR